MSGDLSNSDLPCPYVGLRPFREDESDLFFGREHDIERIVNQIATSHFLVVYAPSGVGKTSLLRAGVIPQLRQDPSFEVMYFDSWKESLVDQVVAALHSTQQPLRVESEATAAGHDSYDRAPILLSLAKRRREETQRRPILVLDQFEELVKYNRDLDQVWDVLAPIANVLDSPASVIIALREDYLGLLDGLMDRVPSLMQNRCRVSSLTHDQLRSAIERPLTAWNPAFTIDTVLADRILADLAESSPRMLQEPIVEPGYLQVVCLRLWELECENPKRQIRLDTYKSHGGAIRIVEEHIRRTIEDALDENDWEIFAAMVRYLVTPSGAKVALSETDLVGFVRWADLTAFGRAIVRREIPESALRSGETDFPLQSPGMRKRVRHIVEQLSATNVFILRRRSSSGYVHFELSHDLLGPILRDWREGIEVRSTSKVRDYRGTEKERAEELLSLVKQSAHREDQFESVATEGCCLAARLVGAAEYKHHHGPIRGLAKLLRHNELVNATIARFGGTTVKNINDGVLAFFQGEDAANRAVQAALDSVRTLSEANAELQLSFPDEMITSIGVQYGPVWRVRLGDSDHLDVQGQTVDIALELARIADLMQVVLTEDAFDFAGGSKAFPSRSEPVERFLSEVYEVQKVVAVSRDQGKLRPIPLAGRAPAPDTLEASEAHEEISRALAEGNIPLAVEECERLIDREKHNVFGIYRYAEILFYHFRGDPAGEPQRLDHAYELVCRARSIRPDSFSVWRLLGWIRFRQFGLNAEQISLLNDAIEHATNALNIATSSMDDLSAAIAKTDVTIFRCKRSQYVPDKSHVEFGFTEGFLEDVARVFDTQLANCLSNYDVAKALVLLESGSKNETEIRRLLNRARNKDPRNRLVYEADLRLLDRM